MAYPYQISSTAFLPEPVYTPGPYSYNGSIYVVLYSTAVGIGDFIHVVRSADDGATWAEQDSGNKKAYYQSGTDSPVDTFRLGTKLYITYVPTGGAPGSTQLDIAEFDMASDLWGTVITGGPTPGDRLRFKSFKLSTGDIRTVFSDLTGASRVRVNIATYTGGVWGASTVLFDPGVTESTTFDYRLQCAAIDGSDNIGILCNNQAGGSASGRFKFRIYSAAGSAGTFRETGLNTYSAIPPPMSGPSAIVQVGSGAIAYAFPVFQQILPSSSILPGVVFVTPSSAPTSVRHEAILDTTRTIDSQGSAIPFASAFYVSSQSALFLYWAYTDGSDQFKIKRACTKLLGWSGPADVFTPASGVNQTINAVCAQVVNTDKVGIVFSAWKDTNTSQTYQYPHYYQEDLPTCSADGCPGGSGNINAAR